MAKTRRPRGSGCYDKCGEYERWRVGVPDPLTGKTVYISIKAKSKAALKEKVEAWKEKHGAGAPASPLSKRWRVADWVQAWLEMSGIKCTQGTLTHYHVIARKHILPAFGSLRLDKFSSLSLQAYFSGLLEGHTPATVAEIRSVFRSCFALAAKHGILPKNPVSATIPPRYEKPELKILNKEDIEKMLNAAKAGGYLNVAPCDSLEYREKRNHLIVLIGASAGLRLGEVLGLTWECVRGGELLIKRALQDVPGERVLKSTKTGKTRTAAIPRSVGEKLMEWKEFQARYAEKYRGIYKNEMSLVFTGVEGNPVDGRHFTRHDYKRICEAAGIQPLPRYHDLRHFAASSAIASGVPLPVVAEQLGHSNISTTLQRYTHVLNRSRDELREALDSFPLFSL